MHAAKHYSLWRAVCKEMELDAPTGPKGEKRPAHKGLRVTPAMASGLSETVMDWSDFVELMDDQPTKKRGPSKKTAAEISN